MDRTSSYVETLLEKMRSADPDYRFMALNDLITRAKADDFGIIEESTESKAVNQVLDLMKDTNGEVRNMTVRTLGTLVRRVREKELSNITNRLVEYINGREIELRDIASLGLKTVIVELPATSKLAASISMKVAPKLIRVIKEAPASQELLIDSLDIVSEIFSRFGPAVSASKNDLQKPALDAFYGTLNHVNAGVRKHAMTALGTLGTCSSSEVFTEICSPLLKELSKGTSDSRRTRVLLLGVLARTSPRRIGRRMPEFMPALLALVQSEEEDEMLEACLQTVETLLLRCVSEVTPFVSQSVDAAVRAITYDPNYAGGVDSDEEMEDEFDDDDDELEMEDYDDDEDMSWKVRRSSAKILTAAINTRPETLAQFAERVLPVLVSRVSDREETVRLEVLQTLVALLKQARLYSTSPQATEVIGGSPGALKRKFVDMEPEVDITSAKALIQARVDDIVKAISKELASKSTGTRIACLAALRELVLLLHGGLDAHLGTLLTLIEKAAKEQTSSGGKSVDLRLEVLSLLRLVFETHAPTSYEEHLAKFVPLLIANVEERMQKNSAEALQTVSQLIVSLRPSFPSTSSGNRMSPARTLEPSQPITSKLYMAIVARLNRQDSDQAMRQEALRSLAVVLSHAGDDVRDRFGECFPMLLERLKNELTRSATLQLIVSVAPSPVCTGPDFETFLLQAAATIADLLKTGTSTRQSKSAAFESLVAILSRLGCDVPPALVDDILSSITPLLGESADINIVPSALQTIAVIVTQKKALAPKIRNEVVPQIYAVAVSSAAQGPALQALIDFFMQFVKADPSSATPILDDLFGQADLLKKTGSDHSTQSLNVLAKCIGAVVRQVQGNTGHDALERAKVGFAAKDEQTLFLSLRLSGEIGRVVDLSGDADLLKSIIACYDSSVEEVRDAAAYALGGLAVGNLAAFIPVIEQHISSNESKRYLSLHALKEVIAHSRASDLVPVAERIWQPLFDISDSKDEASRSISAECLGRLTMADPERYLVQLQSYLRADSASARAAVLVAVRYTLTEHAGNLDELLAPLIVDFLALLKDAEVEVRRHAVLVFNSAAYNKPHLIREWLGTLLPLLYKQTVPDPTLLRKVPMGPFTITQDDGLELRKSSFETMITILDTCFNKIAIEEFITTVVNGMNDADATVKVLCCMMLIRLASLAPVLVATRLDEIAGPLLTMLRVKLKDNATQQEVEKAAELQRAIFRSIIALDKISSHSASPAFAELVTESKAKEVDM